MLLEYLPVMRECGFGAKGYGTAKSFATVWYVGHLTAMAELLPCDARADSAHVRYVLASVVARRLGPLLSGLGIGL